MLHTCMYSQAVKKNECRVLKAEKALGDVLLVRGT